MKNRVFLVQWNALQAQILADDLCALGWQVHTESENGGRAYRQIRTSLPDIVVLDLQIKPEHGREIGRALRGLRATSTIPIVCIEEGFELREQTRLFIPDAFFTTQNELTVMLNNVEEQLQEERAAPSSRRSRRLALAS